MSLPSVYMLASVYSLAVEYVPSSVNNIAVLIRDIRRLYPVVLISYTMTERISLDFCKFVCEY